MIVGGGMAADAACRGIRAHDQDGTIGLVGAEPDPPYSRPPLSKGLWQGRDEASIWRGTEALGVDLHLGRRVLEVDRRQRTLVDDRGDRLSYERLLLATGGRPRRLLGSAADEVIAFRTVADYRRLGELAGPGVPAVVVGGGFIGSELAAALAGAGCRVTICFPEPGIGARLFPPELAAAVDGLYREHGVEVRSGRLVERVDRGPDGLEVVLAGGERLAGTIVVAGLGIEPETELGAQSGLTVDDGIVVDVRGAADERGEVFAAGDVARFPARLLGRLLRVEHEDHANSHGFAVGANMAGAGAPYDHLPFFYSDLFELGYEAVGEVDTRLDTVAEWAEPLRRGVVAYLDDGRRPRGFLLWNLFGRVAAAREAIAAGEPLSAGTLAGLIG